MQEEESGPEHHPAAQSLRFRHDGGVMIFFIQSVIEIICNVY